MTKIDSAVHIFKVLGLVVEGEKRLKRPLGTLVLTKKFARRTPRLNLLTLKRSLLFGILQMSTFTKSMNSVSDAKMCPKDSFFGYM